MSTYWSKWDFGFKLGISYSSYPDDEGIDRVVTFDFGKFAFHIVLT